MYIKLTVAFSCDLGSLESMSGLVLLIEVSKVLLIEVSKVLLTEVSKVLLTEVSKVLLIEVSNTLVSEVAYCSPVGSSDRLCAEYPEVHVSQA